MAISVGFFADVDPFDDDAIQQVFSAVDYWLTRIEASKKEVQYVVPLNSWINRQIAYRLPAPTVTIVSNDNNNRDLSIVAPVSFINNYADYLIVLAANVPKVFNRKGNVHYWEGVEKWL